jgi:hypothetical protein
MIMHLLLKKGNQTGIGTHFSDFYN